MFIVTLLSTITKAQGLIRTYHAHPPGHRNTEQKRHSSQSWMTLLLPMNTNVFSSSWCPPMRLRQPGDPK